MNLGYHSRPQRGNGVVPRRRNKRVASRNQQHKQQQQQKQQQQPPPLKSTVNFDEIISSLPTVGFFRPTQDGPVFSTSESKTNANAPAAPAPASAENNAKLAQLEMEVKRLEDKHRDMQVLTKQLLQRIDTMTINQPYWIHATAVQDQGDLVHANERVVLEYPLKPIANSKRITVTLLRLRKDGSLTKHNVNYIDDEETLMFKDHSL